MKSESPWTPQTKNESPRTPLIKNHAFHEKKCVHISNPGTCSFLELTDAVRYLFLLQFVMANFFTLTVMRSVCKSNTHVISIQKSWREIKDEVGVIQIQGVILYISYLHASWKIPRDTQIGGLVSR